MFDVHGQIRTTPVPESGTRPDLDETVARREAAGVVQQVHKHLLDLNIVQKKRFGGGGEPHADLDVFRFDHRRQLMHGLGDAGLDVSTFARSAAGHLRTYAHLEHGRGQPGEALDAALHSLQHADLLRIERSELVIEQQAAVSLYRHERSAQIVDAVRKKCGAVLIVLLQLQIGMQEVLQHFVALQAKLLGSLAVFASSHSDVVRHGLLHQGVQKHRIDGLQDDATTAERQLVL